MAPLWIGLAVLAAIDMPAEAFQPATAMRATRSVSPFSAASIVRPYTTSPTRAYSNEEPQAEVADESKTVVAEFFESDLWKQMQDVNNKFWDYTCAFLYVAISCLILLNFCGFGYTITAEEGLNVMPVQTYIQERQWKEEIARSSMTASPVATPEQQKGMGVEQVQIIDNVGDS